MKNEKTTNIKVKNVKMMIQDELLSDCKEYELETIDCCLSNNEQIKLIKLIPENVKKIECMLRYNPDYPQFINLKDLSDDDKEKMLEKIKEEKTNNDKKAKEKIYKYPSTHYILAFNRTITKNEKIDDELYKYFINAILKKISSENHTRTSSKAINEIAKNICKEFQTPDELIDCLKEPYDKDNYTECEYKLIKCISQKTGGKHNFSLATKFCHYMNFIIYFGTEYVNLFSIYDSILQENLHYYYNYYVNKEKDNVNKPLPQDRKYKYKSSELKNLDDTKAWEKLLEIYQEYQTIIDEIISNTKISRNGFDHLVWYTGKNN